MRRILPRHLVGRAMIWLLVITTLALGLYPPETVAMLVPALPAAAESSSDSHRMADLQKIQTVLELKVVRQRLEDFGLSQEEINARLAALSDDQYWEKTGRWMLRLQPMERHVTVSERVERMGE